MYNFFFPLQKIKDEKYAWDVKMLQLLLVMEKLVRGRKLQKRQTSLILSPETDNEDDYEADINETVQSTLSGYLKFHLS